MGAVTDFPAVWGLSISTRAKVDLWSPAAFATGCVQLGRARDRLDGVRQRGFTEGRVDKIYVYIYYMQLTLIVTVFIIS